MASVSKRGNNYNVRFRVNGCIKTIYGFTNKREAERVGEKLEALVSVKTTGEMTPDLTQWVTKLAASDSELYRKLAKFGLVEALDERYTLGDLFRLHREHKRDISPGTVENYVKAEANLIEFFGESREVRKVTPRDADRFVKWLRETPLNRRAKNDAKIYSVGTVNRRVKRARQFFSYAQLLGWIDANPFQHIRGGESTNPEKWCYVKPETVIAVIDASRLPKWRCILALGRFAGVRGSSELYRLTWNDIHFGSDGEPGQVIIPAEKNKRHGRRFRAVPMHPILERELLSLFAQAPEGEPLLFPGMKKKANLATMTMKSVLQAGVVAWPNVWYNLRKSFCCDLMEAGIDPAVYEAITDHTYAIAMKHYQIPHAARLQRGYEKILESWKTETPAETETTPANQPVDRENPLL